ncbi:vacuolar iron transporter homolog 4-like [Salvia miltiorrhiza]|uniref:vacuolar iron transporter homolog 4-like n=1 Tax=Salvia miltiorrhiza TaxID=226208 RepID=UPI0025AD905D|nr:vacuolar iron transporter homolog 4-like [Salvia miltiorrhiza]
MMAFPNHMEITIPRENAEQNHGNIRVVPEVEAFDLSLRAQWLQAAVLGANDGFVSVASLMMGVGVVKDEVRVVILTFLAGIFASACSMAIGELVYASSQLEVVIAQMKRDGSANPFQPALQSCFAFSVGAFAPILVAAYITEYSVRLAVVMVGATTVGLLATGCLGTALSRSQVGSSCVRVLVGGWMAMAIAVCFSKLLAASGMEM